MTRAPDKKIRLANPRSLAAACLLLLTLALPRPGMAQSPPPSPAYPVRWDYRVVPLGSIDGTSQLYNGTPATKPFEEGLGKFGSDGWELVAIDMLQGNKIAIFKRPGTTAPR